MKAPLCHPETLVAVVAHVTSGHLAIRTRTMVSAGTFGMGLCLGAFGRRLGFPAAVTVEVHAGAAYVEWLREIIAQAPLTHHTGKRLVVTVEEPLKGLEIGQRLGWYKARRIAVETQTRLWESGQLTARA